MEQKIGVCGGELNNYRVKGEVQSSYEGGKISVRR